MKKIFALQLTIAFVFIHLLSVHAQDSVKKVKPAKAPVKTYVKPGPYKPAGGYYYHSRFPVKHAVDSNHKTYAVPGADTSKTAAAKPDAPTDKSLNGQYQYLLGKVYYYQQPLIAAFHKIIMDTLNQARHDLKSAKTQLSAQTKTIDSLQNAAKTEGQDLSESATKVNEISLLGIAMDKSTYNLLMWGLVVVFGAAAAIVIARSGAAGHEAKYRTQLYNELDEEFKAYKAKANEKEKKLARELQTERNRLDDLLGKS
jgi:hypothetical protein